MNLASKFKLISAKILVGHSAFVLVPGGELDKTADYLSQVVRGDGLNPVRISAQRDAANISLEDLGSATTVMLLTLAAVPDQRTARFCKHIATTSERTGLVWFSPTDKSPNSA